MNHPNQNSNRRNAGLPDCVLMQHRSVTSLEAGHSDRVDGAAMQDGRLMSVV